MELRTFRASTMHEALALVRRELGPDAAVLHTREVRSGRLLGILPGRLHIEVTASRGVHVPSRLPPPDHRETGRFGDEPATYSRPQPATPPRWMQSLSESPPPPAGAVHDQLEELRNLVQDLCRRSRGHGLSEMPEELFHLFTWLIDADVHEDLARELVERVRQEYRGAELKDPVMLQARIARMIEAELHVSGPIQTTPGRRRVAALVGPTGVGKTTTIAKLAANFRLKEKRRVGLITVDTYRIAAVEQLRTYAEIIDLPMQVVSTPREMREAVRRMAGLDLVLMDTAGRSPKDEVRLQELKAFLSEAGADEVHLVLSSIGSTRTLEQTAQRFAAVGTTALILTKLDEASSLGSVLPVLRSCKLPLSYLTNGQNVPDDIEIAKPAKLAKMVLGLETAEVR
ncbi:MAG: flagellar biosynthesis protein FlhF [Pirellulales bacterium]|nr:flagellar biosynthesis protein FlhF [Pirellulales bacterium]